MEAGEDKSGAPGDEGSGGLRLLAYPTPMVKVSSPRTIRVECLVNPDGTVASVKLIDVVDAGIGKQCCQVAMLSKWSSFEGEDPRKGVITFNFK